MERIFTQTFGVVGAIIEKDGKIILVKEAKEGTDKGKWDHPGGWIEIGENPIEGVKREVKEETGLDFTPTHILGIYSLVREDLQSIHHPIKIIFLGDISDKKIGELFDDVSEKKWFKPEEIEKMDSATLRDLDTKKMIRDYSKGQKYPLNILTHTIDKL